jgi:23S rRNA-/tRNA-specific pseudouridylate synthase
LIDKEYNAVVAAPNRLGASGVIEARLRPSPQRRDCMEVTAKGGQRAVTRYTVLATTGGSRVGASCSQRRGRQHQLRVHLAYLGAPILGDRLYGDVTSAPRLMLHAHTRSSLPATLFGRVRRFEAPLPVAFTPPAAD